MVELLLSEDMVGKKREATRVECGVVFISKSDLGSRSDNRVVTMGMAPGIGIDGDAGVVSEQPVQAKVVEEQEEKDRMFMKWLSFEFMYNDAGRVAAVKHTSGEE